MLPVFFLSQWEGLVEDSSCLKLDKKTLLWGTSAVSTGKAIQSVETTQLFDFGQVTPLYQNEVSSECEGN